MITPRSTRVVRVPSLRALQRAVAVLGAVGDPWTIRDTAVLVPTASAGDELRRTLERLFLVEAWQPSEPFVALRGPTAAPPPSGLNRAFVPPWLVTREGLWDLLHARYGPLPPRLNEFEREALLAAAASAVRERGVEPPFTVRPGLVSEMLALYDGLRRRYRTIAQFEQHAGAALESSAEFDRGARRLMQQTRFLAAVFREYETRMVTADALDEHALRERLLSATSASPLVHVIVTVADQAADAFGLWPSDFDLLTRLPGLERIDIVATDALLDAGFLPRLMDTLPEIEVVRLASVADSRPLVVHPRGIDGAKHFVLRDREEEMAHIVRWLQSATDGWAPDAHGERLGRVAVVFQKPLPYLYVGRTVFDAARLPFQAFDAMPLASEPFSVAFDLLVSVPLLDWTRGALVALLRSPLFAFVDGAPFSADDVDAFDRALRDAQYLGGHDRLPGTLERLSTADAAERPRGRKPRVEQAGADGLHRVCRVVAAIASMLEPLTVPAPAARHLEVLITFIDRFSRPIDPRDPRAEREGRARQAIRSLLESLWSAHATHGDRTAPFRDLVMTMRRWIEGQTFSPRTGGAGVHLVDAQAARFGSFRTVALVGLVEGEWQAGSSRSIFYPASILSNLGWPKEADRQSAARAGFADLLVLAERRVMVTTFTLEDDTVVKPSTFLEDVQESGLDGMAIEVTSDRVFVDEALALEPVVPGILTGGARAWLDARMRPPTGSLDESSRLSSDVVSGGSECAARGAPGQVDTRVPSYAVTRLETYLQCPFRYFAAHVLRLEEEQGEEVGLSPQERGMVLHEVFESFFERWTRASRAAISPATLADARALMAEVADEVLGRVAPEDREIERARLLGSPTSIGFAEQVFRAEVERGGTVLERLLEHRLDGEYVLEGSNGPRPIVLRGVADRIDVLDNGELRIYDYKSSRAPHTKTRLQLPVYAWCAEQQLDGRRGRAWRVSDAAYLAAKAADGVTRAFEGLDKRDAVITEGLARLVASVEGIEGHSFPVDPVEQHACTFCPYPAVCRKDDLGDD